MTALRKCMDPDSMDMLMFLKANKELWSDARTVQNLLDSLTPTIGLTLTLRTRKKKRLRDSRR